MVAFLAALASASLTYAEIVRHASQHDEKIIAALHIFHTPVEFGITG